MIGRLVRKIEHLGWRRRARETARELFGEHRRRLTQTQYFDVPPRRVAFLCHGNICRSPFAMQYVNNWLKRQSRSDVSVVSAGLRTREGASTPDWFVAIASEFDVDLSRHRSQPVDLSLVETADAIVAMDMRNWFDLHERFPEAEGKAVLLGLFAGDEHVEIDDPYIQEEPEARETIRRLIRALDKFIETITRRQPGA